MLNSVEFEFLLYVLSKAATNNLQEAALLVSVYNKVQMAQKEALEA